MNSQKPKSSLGPGYPKQEIVFLSTFPPTKCGIATFVSDLLSSARELFGNHLDLKVVAVSGEIKNKSGYDQEVIYQIPKNKKEKYRECADFLNRRKEIAVVCVQHEFGIYGGESGSHLLLFLKRIKKPVFITFHSVIPNPDKKLFQLVKQIAKYSQKIVVMSNNSKKVLASDYQLPKSKVVFIPHGIHLYPYEKNFPSKKELGLADRTLLLTFGFLSPNKGIEYVIEALPEVVKKCPKILYLIVGQTHPVIKKNEGEKYRQLLLRKIKKLELNKNVKFVNSFQSLGSLILYLKAADIYISTSVDPNQAVSGTFSYALGSGRALISTRFKQSEEYLKKDMGVLVKPGNSEEYTKALLSLLANRKKRLKMGKNCYFRTRNMVWQNVALCYTKIFSQYISKKEVNVSLPPVSLKHLYKLTDKFGILQFAKLSQPDPGSGYTVDDNARALIVASLYFQKTGDKSALKFVKIYLDFLDYTLNSSGVFRNYVNYDRSFNKRENEKNSPEDPNSRALYALARISSIKCLPKKIREKAEQIFEKSVQKNIKFTHLRPIAFYLKALYFYKKNKGTKKEIECYANILITRFEKHRAKNWTWFEDMLTYSNGVVPEALTMSYLSTENKKYLKTGIVTADFLMRKTFHKKLCVPIGQNGWLQKGKEKQFFDQQPEEVTSLVEMLKTLYQVTKKEKYKVQMRKAFHWFLGGNTLSQLVCDFGTGGCYDGVGEKEINLNQGAESTISYLIARLTVS
ncbi:MAG: glycosyltransferase family 4 protein [Candidatus Moraniibacteriota bacterium]